MFEQKMETDDNRALFGKSPVKLIQMASANVSIALWYRNTFRYNFEAIPDDCWPDFENILVGRARNVYPFERRSCQPFRSIGSIKSDAKKSLSELTLPRDIIKSIRTTFELIAFRIETWISYHYERVFLDSTKDSCLAYMTELKWKCDGRIDYLKTAKHLLSSPRVSDVDKYRIMCTYCLEDAMKNVSPNVLGDEAIENVSFSDHPLIFYWKCRANGELDRISFDGFESVESRIISVVDNKWALQYLWSRLNEEDKVNNAIRLILKHGLKYQIFLLNQLNEVQQHRVFMRIATQILINFAEEESYYEYAMSTWLAIRNYTTEERFVDILERLFGAIRYALSRYPRNYILSLIRNICTEAPVDLRRFASTYNDGILIDKIMGNHAAVSLEFIFEFVLEMLPNDCPSVRKNVTGFRSCVDFCIALIKARQPYLFDRFVRSCLNRSEEVVEYKKQVMYVDAVKYSFERSFTCMVLRTMYSDETSLSLKEKIDRFDDELMLYLSDDYGVAEYRAQLFTFIYSAPGDYTNALNKLSLESQCQLFVHILSGANPGVKKKFLMSRDVVQLCEWMVKRSRHKLLDFVINLCLDVNESRSFKKQILMEGYCASHCLNLVDKEGDLKKMNEFLGRFLSDVVDLADCKVGILSSDEGERASDKFRYRCSKTECLEEHFEFLSQITNASEDMKRKLIDSPFGRELIREYYIPSGRLSCLDNFVNSCVRQDEVVHFKRTLMDANTFLEFSKRGLLYLDMDKLADLLECYAPNEQAIKDFLSENKKLIKAKRFKVRSKNGNSTQ